MSPSPPASKAGRIQVLRCLNPECSALLAYEVLADNVLYLDLAWTAHRSGDKRFFPCPKCKGKNIVEPFRTESGASRQRVTRWEA